MTLAIYNRDYNFIVEVYKSVIVLTSSRSLNSSNVTRTGLRKGLSCGEDHPYQVSVKNTDSSNLHPPTRGPVKSRDAELTNITMIWGRVEAVLEKIFLKSQKD